MRGPSAAAGTGSLRAECVRRTCCLRGPAVLETGSLADLVSREGRRDESATPGPHRPRSSTGAVEHLELNRVYDSLSRDHHDGLIQTHPRLAEPVVTV